MEKTLIFGHKNPDTDSITASIIMADIETKLGNDNVEAVKLGKINKETAYVLNYFKIDEPRTIENLDEVQNVILVDHNEFSQSAIGIENVTIKKVIDHHKIENFRTADPVYYRAEPVGCTSTILYKLYLENGLNIESKMAGLMLSAIISDTLLFKSPTCTKEDLNAAEKLAKIANLDVNKYGNDMLRAGTDLSDLTIAEMINIDAKEFDINSLKVEIAQINTVDIESVLKRQEELKNEINNVIKNKGLDLFIFVITDILENNSQIIALGNRAELVQKAYEIKLENDQAFLPGVVSRKKQILPPLVKNA